MSNWRFFVGLAKGYAPYFRRPKFRLVEKREDDNFLKSHKEAWAYYNQDEVEVVILKEKDCPALRLHECGHWLNVCVYFALEVIWEFFWWGLGIRSLFDKRPAHEEVRDAD